jgi:hypothetical protein
MLFPIMKLMNFRRALGIAANNGTSGKHFLNTSPSSMSVHCFQTLAKQTFTLIHIHLD